MARIAPGIDSVEQDRKRLAQRSISGTAYTLVWMQRRADFLPLKVVFVHLGGQAHPIRLEQHDDVRATELEEAEHLALGQLCAQVPRLRYRRDLGHTDGQDCEPANAVAGPLHGTGSGCRESPITMIRTLQIPIIRRPR